MDEFLENRTRLADKKEVLTDFTGYHTALYHLPGLSIAIGYGEQPGIFIHQELQFKGGLSRGTQRELIQAGCLVKDASWELNGCFNQL